MSSMEVFNSSEFGMVRVLEDGERLLFCGTDVAVALGYNEPRKAVARHTKDGMKRPVLSKGGVQETVVIPEGDVYRLIVNSKLPTAERFERWLFDEAVPTIRKHGAYVTEKKLAELADNPQSMAQLLQDLTEEKEKVKALIEENISLQSKAEYYDAFCSIGCCTSIQTTAKELNISSRQFVEFLLRGGFLYRTVRGVLLPYSDSLTEGLFEVKDFCQNGHHGVYTLITPKGKSLFRLMLPKNNADRRKSNDI